MLLVDDILGERPAGLAQSQTYPRKYALAGHRIGVGMGFSISMFRLHWGPLCCSLKFHVLMVREKRVPCHSVVSERGSHTPCCSGSLHKVVRSVPGTTSHTHFIFGS